MMQTKRIWTQRTSGVRLGPFVCGNESQDDINATDVCKFLQLHSMLRDLIQSDHALVKQVIKSPDD